MNVAVLIVAAGRGTRMGSDVPKQYIDLKGKPVLKRTVEAFLGVPECSQIRTVINGDDEDLYQSALGSISDRRLLPPTHGGETRAASVSNGLKALARQKSVPEFVLIHDAARPFVSQDAISNCIEVLSSRDTDGVCLGLKLVDALWRVHEDEAENPVPRDNLWRAQTPQGFRFDAILSAHDFHDGSGADDVFVAREAGLRVTMIEGSEQNYKITTQADLRRAERDLETG